MKKDPVIIIGGGIGGLALANALYYHDIPFELFEQAPELTEVGAGIGLSRSAIHILDRMGFEESFRSHAANIRRVYFSGKNLNVRRTIPVSLETACIHRARLIDILKSELPASNIHLSKKAAEISFNGRKGCVLFEDGEKKYAEMIVAADGIHSAIRKQLFPEINIRYIHQTIWRGLSDEPMPAGFDDSYIEIWDNRLRFLTIPLGDGQTFWLGVQPAPPGGEDNPSAVRDKLLNLFKDFHEDLKKLIRTSKNFIRNDMGDLGTEKRKWHYGPVVFLGDSIHATTPNLGQGGCQAIEDAWCLALCISKYGKNREKVFHTYQELRESKVMKIVKDSWLFGRAAHSANPFLHYGYRTILTHAPDFALRKQEKFLNDLSYLKKL
jgi:2-polyprenyl-6-methoxyphenol hydroxylase-like FAD-dependent oxidoreductase